MPLWHSLRSERAHWRGSRWTGWELVWQVVDAHACPRCGAFVRGKERYKHEADHEKIDTAVAELSEAIAVVARAKGLSVRSRGDDDGLDDDGGEEPVTGYVIGNGAMPTVGEYDNG